MKYYSFHLGDYSTHTAHLDPMEDLAYRRMIDLYYLTESPLPTDLRELSRLIRLRDQGPAIEAVLAEFFVLTDAGWSNLRCDAEIARFKDKADKASKAGKLSAERRLNASSTNAQRTLNEEESDAQLTNNQEPITNNQDIEPKGSRQQADRLPACPQDKIISLYHEHLPELPQARVMSKKREKSTRDFWRWVLTSKRTDGNPRAQNAQEALDWISSYFDRAKSNDFLMGRIERTGPHSNWKCDYDFLLTDSGKKQVIEKT